MIAYEIAHKAKRNVLLDPFYEAQKLGIEFLQVIGECRLEFGDALFFLILNKG